MKISELNEKQIVKLIENRWNSSQTVWDTIDKVYDQNTKIYANQAEWINKIPKKRIKVQANRVFVNTEAVINTLIANPAAINFIPTRETPEARELAMSEEQFFQKKFRDINFKETLRMGLRNLYFGRLIVIKAFWDHTINDFNFKALDPRKIRVAKHAKNETETDFVIEEVEDTLSSLITRFPDKEKEILKESGYTKEDAFVNNIEIKYKECWIQDHLICKYGNVILSKDKNPYFDWDGLLVTKEEYGNLQQSDDLKQRRIIMNQVRATQDQKDPVSSEAYYFNYFDKPRKPYIFATVFNNEDSPIGRTDMITMASPLQQAVDKRKQDIDENCELSIGIIKVESSVMGKKDAQSLAFETKGIIWGDGVVNGVQRETGNSLPQMVFDDMIDSRQEIDNIMAASSAFRGEREGQETKAGRLALIEQSFQRLNELVQVVDYVSGECFKWASQLAKTRYLEEHYAKWIGKENTSKIIGFMQDDFVNGTEIEVIPGKTLPLDAQFRFERAKEDVANGIISPIDYLEEAGYSNPKQMAQNSVLYKQNPAYASGIQNEDMPPPFIPGQPTDQQIMQEGM